MLSVAGVAVSGHGAAVFEAVRRGVFVGVAQGDTSQGQLPAGGVGGWLTMGGRASQHWCSTVIINIHRNKSYINRYC